ncbi:oxidoreductase, zinc-binding dehydrogenase family [Rhodobacteraceae bacterium KLH11]|nr:oxidoreductase, zinc-binding dehydrogenase family [Rhodobacteraceae bacterium KLH11]
MKAITYRSFGAASEVLELIDMPTPDPAPGEVLVRVHASGINPSDVKLRSGARPGAVMQYPVVIPHSDGAGVIEAVGAGVDPARIGERVWIWNGQWQRAFGTGAEYIALPSDQAVSLPDTTSFAEGACFGIPALTAWYALYRDGPITDQTVLVTGGAGTVGRYACQMAALGGARVITTVSSDEKAAHSGAAEWINYRTQDVAEAVMDLTNGAGVDRIIEVDFAANQATSLSLIRPGGTIASYASASRMKPELDFYGFMFKNVRLHMLIVYQLDAAARRRGEAQLGQWLEQGALSHAVVPAGGLTGAATAHQMVEVGQKLGTVVLEV